MDSSGGRYGLLTAPTAVLNDLLLDRSLAGPNDGVQIIEVGNPAHPPLKRAWEAREGRDWPRDPVTGRAHDVAHIRAIADGGSHTLDNIRPLHRLEHLTEHMANGDFARWGRRPGIARAFGGVVGAMEGPLGILSDITGILSGRIRIDNFDNFASDMAGIPSREDRLRAYERYQKALSPDWKPGDPDRI